MTCTECGSTWDPRAAGFCGRCGALLDSPVGRSLQALHGGDGSGAPARRRKPPGTAVAAVVLGVALVAGGAVLDGGGDQDAVAGSRVALPTPGAASAPDGPARAAPPAPSVTCEVDSHPVPCNAWVRPVSGAPLITPAASGLLSVDGDHLTLFDPATGGIMWQLYGADEVLPVGESEVVVLRGAEVFVVDTADRRFRVWVRRQGALQGRPLLVRDGLLLEVTAAAGPGGVPRSTVVVARSVRDGTVEWQQAVPDHVTGGPVQAVPVGDDVLVETPAEDGRVDAVLLDTAAGTVHWAETDTGTFVGHAGDLLVFEQRPAGIPESAAGAPPVWFEGRHRADGTLQWASSEGQEPRVTGADAIGGLLLLDQQQGGTAAITIAEGQPQWERRDVTAWPARTVDGRDPAAPAVPHLVVMTWSRSRVAISRLDPDTGAALWTRLAPPGTGTEAPIVSGDRVYVEHQDGVTLLDAATGREVATVSVPEPAIVVLEPLVLHASGHLVGVDLAGTVVAAASRTTPS